LSEQAEHSGATGIIEIGPEEAQLFANLGYTVIGAWKNLRSGYAPHYVTVRPVDVTKAYDNDSGPEVAHVGAPSKETKTGNRITTTSNAYGNIPINQIRWFLNIKQEFQFDLTGIQSLQWRKQ
jgi:hypothetical protein